MGWWHPAPHAAAGKPVFPSKVKTRPTRRNQRREVDPLVTLDRVAEELGVSAQFARIIEIRALKKLRTILESRGYQLSDFID